MRKMTSVSLALIFIFVVFSCKNVNDNHNDSGSNIKIETIKSYQDFLNDYSITEIIPLETTKESLLGMIWDIFIYKNRIYVHNMVDTEGLLCFTSKGKFLFKVGNVGKGPGEYIQPSCAWIGETNGTEYIKIHDGFSRRNLFYDISNGQFIKDESTDDRILQDCKQVGNYLICHQSWHGSENKDRLLIYEQSPLKIKYSGLESKSEFDLFTNRGCICEPFNNEHVLFATGAEDIIHEVSPNGITKKYLVDFGKKSVPEKDKLEFDFDNYEEGDLTYYKGKYFSWIGDLCETNENILFSFSDLDQAYVASYNKKNETCISYKTPLKVADYIFSAFPCPVTTIGDTLVSFISTYSIDIYNKENKLIDVTVDESDNPILIKYIKRIDSN